MSGAVAECRRGLTEVHVAVLESKQQLARASRALERACPVGSTLAYRWGAHTHFAEVVMHGAGLRMFVKNTSTHGARWIGHYMLTEIQDMDEKYKRRAK